MTMKLLWIAIAGAIGTLARYGLSGLVQRLDGTSFPWGTFAVNVVGCFFFGVIWMVADRHVHFPSGVRSALLIGFLGAFTTFSTYMFESVELLRAGQYLSAVGNMGGQMAVSLVALVFGILLGRLI